MKDYSYNGRCINICGIVHAVKEVDDIFNGEDLHLGQINHATAEIVLNSGLNGQVKEEALCHEIVHGILFHTGHEELGNDEEFVQQMANAIRQSFNVKFFR